LSDDIFSHGHAESTEAFWLVDIDNVRPKFSFRDEGRLQESGADLVIVSVNGWAHFCRIKRFSAKVFGDKGVIKGLRIGETWDQYSTEVVFQFITGEDAEDGKSLLQEFVTSKAASEAHPKGWLLNVAVRLPVQLLVGKAVLNVWSALLEGFFLLFGQRSCLWKV
jgi:hypothetical protein